MARVSVRTLRLYDHEGLLRPRERSLSGHRLYADEDLIVLERILALKLLGFTLAEIRACLALGPQEIAKSLAQQRAMLEDRRIQIDRSIQAIETAEARVREGRWDWDSLLSVMEAMRMQNDRSWVRRHLTEEQIRAIEEIAERTGTKEGWNSPEALAWTEEDQIRINRGWAEVYAEAERLSDLEADPAGPEARALAERYDSLIREFTKGDPEREAMVVQFYAEARKLPEAKNPYPGSPRAREFAEKAYAAYRGA